MKLYSLRGRTLRAFLLPLVAAGLVIMLIAGIVSFLEISAQHDDEMRKAAALLMLLGQHEASEQDSLEHADRGVPMFPRKIRGAFAEYRISSKSVVVARSAGMPDLLIIARPGIRNINIGGKTWRVVTLTQQSAIPGPGWITVDVAEPLSVRQEQTGRMLLGLLLPVTLLIAAVALIGIRQVSKAIMPISALSADVDNRDVNDLRQIEYHEIPRELAPLADALNRLLQRLGRAIDREREFAENAAHELRTPVAALKARSQILQSRLGENSEVADDITQLLLSVDRAGSVVDRLLELARLSADQLHPANFDLSSVIEDEARMIAPSIFGNGLEFAADIAPGIMLCGFEEAMRAAVRNLLINAAKFTPRGGAVSLALDVVGDDIRLSVTDNGPGVVKGQERLLFDRFWRGPGDSAGSGLGLALVQRAALLHAGTAVAANIKPHGLCVFVRLPRNSRDLWGAAVHAEPST